MIFCASAAFDSSVARPSINVRSDAAIVDDAEIVVIPEVFSLVFAPFETVVPFEDAFTVAKVREVDEDIAPLIEASFVANPFRVWLVSVFFDK